MADINWSIQDGASASLNDISSTPTISSSGSIGNIKDDDESTSYDYGAQGGPGAGTEHEQIVTFAETANQINKVEIVAADDGGPYYATEDMYIYLYYGGSWNKVYSIYDNYNSTFSKQTFSTEGIWSNVSKIKVYYKGSAYDPEGIACGIILKNYELRAWGPKNYLDKGSRVYTGSEVIKIACKELDGHKLRFYDGATTYGIPLVATDDSDASAIRIYDGNSSENLVIQSGDNLAHTITTNNEDSTTGSASNTYDEDDDTYYQCYRETSVSGSDMTMVSQHTWDTGRTVDKVRGKGDFLIRICGYSPFNYYGRFRLYIKQSGSWNKIKEYIYDKDILWDGCLSRDVGRTLSDFTIYSNVEGVKFEVYTKFTHGGVFDTSQLTIRIHEVECQGYTGSGETKALPKMS